MNDALKTITISHLLFLVFPYAKDTFLKDNFSQVGVTDGFGRTHLSPRCEFREVLEKYWREFPTSS
jgi:hypothetical protein